jgi:hypothetical protein
MTPLRVGLGMAAWLLAASAQALPFRLSLETAAMRDLAAGDVAEAQLPLFEATDPIAPLMRRRESSASADADLPPREWQRGAEPAPAIDDEAVPAELRLPDETGHSEVIPVDEAVLEGAQHDPFGVPARVTFADAMAEKQQPEATQSATAALQGAVVQTDTLPAVADDSASVKLQERQLTLIWLAVPIALAVVLYGAAQMLARTGAERAAQRTYPPRRRRHAHRRRSAAPAQAAVAITPPPRQISPS